MDTVTIIDDEKEVVKSKTPIIIAAVAVAIGIGGLVFGFIQKSEKDSLNNRISNLEQSVNIHVAEVEALKDQLIENGIKPEIVTTTETKTATNDKVADTTTSSDSSKTETSKNDKNSTDKKTDSKESAGEGYSDIPLDPGSDWNVKFFFPNGIKNVNYIYPSGTSIAITGITTASKTYDSDTCATGFGQVILGGSTGEKIFSDSKGTYYYVAPSNSKCSGTDYETAVSLAKKLFQSIKAK
ncbi:hypothetical protein IJ114_02050 [Candidatus Saccharibacteria bacterium]|nr:hypothetical protein [Candidatus Saccharibacteria bacterium]